jgi:hypothetical protein
MSRRNFGVRMGRPPATPAMKMGAPARSPTGGRMPSPEGAAPSDGFAPGIPASGFKTGGQAGYACMPRHHDDPAFCGGGKVRR